MYWVDAGFIENLKNEILNDKKHTIMKANQKNWQIMVLLACLILIPVSAISQDTTVNTDFNIGAKEREAIIDTIIVKFNELYVFPEIAKKWEVQLRNKLDNKEYDEISSLSEFIQQLTKDI